MSKLDAIQESASSTEKREWSTTENFALQVVGYGQDSKGRDAIKGIRLDTKEEMTVVLRPYKGVLKAPRADVKDFVAEEGEITKKLKKLPDDEMRKYVLQSIKAKTEPGGTILVQRAYREEDGTINAGWLKSASKYPEHNQVIEKIMLRVNPVTHKERGGKPYACASATALFPKKAQRVCSVDELSEALQTAFKGADDIKGHPLALVRLADKEGAKAIEYSLPVQQNPNTNEYMYATPSQAAKLVLATDMGKKIAALASDSTVLIEVIPGTRIGLGPQTKASFENNEKDLEKINRFYRFSGFPGFPESKLKEKTGFTESYLVLHSTKGGGQVFSAADPLSSKPPLFHMRDINTDHFKAGHPIIEPENQEPPHLNEPSLEMGEASQEDIDFEIDDVVGEPLSVEASTPIASAPAPRMRM